MYSRRRWHWESISVAVVGIRPWLFPSYVNVLEDILTLATRITSLQLYSPAPHATRLDHSPVRLRLVYETSNCIWQPYFLPAHWIWSLTLPCGLLAEQFFPSLLFYHPYRSSGGHLPLTTRAQIEKYEVTTIVTTSEFAEVLLLLLRDDPTAMTTLSAIILVVVE